MEGEEWCVVVEGDERKRAVGAAGGSQEMRRQQGTGRRGREGRTEEEGGREGRRQRGKEAERGKFSLVF